jgi:SNF2 family DNA or RNA helicase
MTTKQITLNQKEFRVEIRFPYSRGLFKRAGELPDSTWENGIWWVPADQMHCNEAVRFGSNWDFTIDTNVLSLARGQVRRSWQNTELREKMYPYQSAGVERIHQMQGRTLLAMDPGTGKTLTALGYLTESPGISRVLVVAPANATYKWQEEARGWIGWDSQVVRTGKEQIDPTARMVIMSYGLLRGRRDVRDITWSVLILDEAHRISNSKSLQSRAVRALNAERILELTGTPVMNRPIELWHMLHVLNPTQWSSWFAFAKRYADGHDEMIHVRGGRLQKVFKVNGASNLEELSQKLRGYMYRVTKAEAMPWLPKLRRIMYPIESHEKFYREYRDLRAKRDTMPAIQLMSQLRQLTATYKISSAVEMAEDLLEQGEKVVLYAYHKSIIRELEERLDKYGLVRITGDEDQQTKFTNNQMFQESEAIRVALVSAAGSEAINLYAASNLIFVEREWNPAREEQIEARLHRAGQEKSVTVHYLVIKDTVDEHLTRLVEEKRDVLSKLYTQNEVDEYLAMNLE